MGLEMMLCSPDVAAPRLPKSRFGVRDLPLADAVDIVQVDVTRAGGFTEMLKCAALTQAWNVKLRRMPWRIFRSIWSAHTRTPLSSLRMFEEITAAIYLNAPLPKDGHMELTEEPASA